MSISQNQTISLYHLGQEYKSLLSQLYDHETGEIDMNVDAKLSALSPNIHNKCIAVSNFIQEMQSEKSKIEFYKQQIAAREAAYDKEITRLHTYLKSNMESLGITEIKAPMFTIKIKKNPYSTDVYDESQLPERFLKTREIIKTETKADKNAIKEEVLKTGVQVPGASVVQKTQLQILVDKL